MRKKNEKASVFLGGLFRSDGGLVMTLDFFSDIVILNILCILCCIPVVTIPASLYTAFCCSKKMLRAEGSGVAGMFFRYFRQSFRRITLPGLAALAVTFVLAMELKITQQMPQRTGTVFRIGLGAMLLIWLETALWLMPVYYHFEKSWKEVLKLSAALAVANLPVTLLMLAVLVLPEFVALLSSGAWAAILLLRIIILVEGTILIQALLTGRVLSRGSGQGADPVSHFR